jgi:hypothetical protein
LTDVVFHHEAMTAKPIFDIWRALLVTMKSLHEANAPSHDGPDDIATMNRILKYIAKEYQTAVGNRNMLLHGTWFIGWGNETTEDFSNLDLMKAKVTATGLTYMATPKSKEEIIALTQQIAALRPLIVEATMDAKRNVRFQDRFVKAGLVWTAPRAQA